ncbi:hypothetical protein DE4585_02634 [Mycobacteroides salmoniphilum]|uniref:Endonuclease/Exonuclease/phosphatase family protein n=1 Tax=Mycobacteroides salmoniphilum TaxID=404941 RepID=A0A4R8S0D6_9MYCO|nr:hypothetical protein [Mycobacteroides salmoniphilum]TDZ82105.1 hypothetical protein DE4585_02634 [Mycobacteroides salmoniphilum]
MRYTYEAAPVRAAIRLTWATNDIRRNIFDKDRTRHFYDQIAWFSTPTGTPLLQSLTYTKQPGSFDFVPHCYPKLTKNELSWRIYDHYPLWAEFQIG